MRKTTAILASFLIIAGCAEDKFRSEVKSYDGPKVVEASISDVSKIYVNETENLYRMFWSEGDAISLISGDTNEELTLTEGADSPRGKFSTEISIPSSDVYYAVAPYNSQAYASGDTIYVNYDSEQVYNDFTLCAEGPNIMVARSTGDVFAFHNAFSYISLEIDCNDTETVNRIEIISNDGSAIAGFAAISFGDDGLPSVKVLDNGSPAVSVDMCSMPITPADPLKVFIPIAPGCSEGFEALIITDSGKSMILKSKNEIPVNSVVKMPKVTFTPQIMAEIGEVKYYSFDEAIQAANDYTEPVTVKLVNDSFVGSDLDVCNNVAEVTIDLNGKTLSCGGDKILYSAALNRSLVIDDNSAAGNGRIVNTNLTQPALKVFGPTTIKGGTIVGTEGRAIHVIGGSLTIDGGTVTSVESDCIYAKAEDPYTVDSISVISGEIRSSNDRAIRITGNTTLNVRGGNISSKKATLYVYDGTINVYGGTLHSNSNTIYGHRDYDCFINVYDGFISRSETTNSIVYGRINDKVPGFTTRVLGGYFSFAPVTDYIPQGYMIETVDTTVNSIKYVAHVVEAPEIAAKVRIGSGQAIDKGTIDEAFAAAINTTESAIITLVSDCAFRDSVSLKSDAAINIDITLDLNGHILTESGSHGIRMQDERATLTIKDSDPEGKGKILQTNNNSYLISMGDGTLNIENGTFAGNNESYPLIRVKGGVFNLKGGTFEVPAFSTIVCYEGSTLNVSGGKIVTRAEEASDYACISSYEKGATVNITGGVFESNGCHFKGNGRINILSGNFNQLIKSACKDMVIEGGRFARDDKNVALVVDTGIATINGGEFEAESKYGALRVENKGTITMNGGTVKCTGSGSGYRAVYVGDTYGKTSANFIMNGGRIDSEGYCFGIYSGKLYVKGGDFNTSYVHIYVGGSSGKFSITDGYFYNSNTGSSNPLCSKSYNSVMGGFFNYSVAENQIATGFQLSKETTSHDGKDYGYRVIENASAPDVATVNGKTFKAFDTAVDEALSYNGPDSEVTLKLVGEADTISIGYTLDFTNENGKPVNLDFNGHVIKGTIDSLITTTGVLTLTDSSQEKTGSLCSAKRKMLFLTNEGTINIKGVEIRNTHASDRYLTSIKSAITIIGESGMGHAAINISDGARLMATNLYKLIYVSYGTLTAENCEITVGSSKSDETGNAYYGIYAYTGAQITLNDGTSMYSPGTIAAPLAIASGNATATSVVINGGYYRGNDAVKESSAGYAMKTLTVNGGYFSTDISGLGPRGGKVIQKLDPPFKHVHNGKELEYGFKY